MRFIDIAVAALIGSSAITAIVAWNPRAGDAGAHQLGAQAQLRDRLLEFLQRESMTPFESPAAACRLLSGASNSTMGLYASMGPTSCGSPPRRGSLNVTLSFRLLPYDVVLVAWSPEQA